MNAHAGVDLSRPTTHHGTVDPLPLALRPLAELRNWVVWRWELNNKGNWTKVPKQSARSQYNAKNNDPATWSDYGTAISTHKSIFEALDGIGFMLLHSDVAALDLDKCRNPETGKINLWAQELVDKASLLGAYVEVTAYILNWLAWAVLHPDERAEVALVLRGKRGTGKGGLGSAMCRIFGQHAVHISSADHLAGRFNAHLRDACVLFADESYWPGDKSAEGTLKRMITEPELLIEAKGRDAVTTRNMLHVLMASNEDWVVPAGEHERRFAVFNVSECHMQDDKYFTPLFDQLENGGYSAMLFDLLHRDLGDWHPRRVPRTDALREQQRQGLSPFDAWWVELLETGVLEGADPNAPSCAVSNAYDRHGARQRGLYDQARTIEPRLKARNDHLLGRFLTDQGCDNSQKVLRRRGWTFPLLLELRKKWEARFASWKWRDPHLAEWQSGEDKE